MSLNRVIGRGGKLPWHIPEDLKHFKKLTLGKPVIMGRKTFESIGKPLPGRANIVVSRSGFFADGIIPARSVDDALQEAEKIAARDGVTEIMIIGGAQVYEQSLAMTDRLYLTVVEETIEGDAFFPRLDETQWHTTAEERRPGPPPLRFVTLDRKQ